MGDVHMGPTARRSWPHHVDTVLLIGLVLATAAFAASTVFRDPEANNAWADLGLYNLVTLLAVALMARRAWSGGRKEKPWAWLAIGASCLVVGDVLWSLATYVTLPPSQPALPELFYLAFYPFAFIALIRLSQYRLPRQSRHHWLESILVGTGVFSVGASILSSHISGFASPADTSTIAVSSLYLMGDLILAAVALSTAQAFGWRPPAAWWLLFAAALTFAVADGAYVMQAAAGTYTEGTWLDIGWSASSLLFGLAVYFDRARPAAERSVGSSEMIVPSILIVAAVLVLLTPVSGPLVVLATATAAATIILSGIWMNLAVREARHLSEELRRVQIDPLTGLPNRRGFQAIPRQEFDGCAVALFNVDRFSEVNDSLGNEAGDRMLRTIAQRIEDATRDSDVIARIGGDEFAVLIRGSDAELGMQVAESIIAAIEEPIGLDGVRLHVSACAGVTSGAASRAGIETLMQEADMALHEAKRQGPGLVRMFAGGSGERSQERLRMRADIRDAFNLGGNEFVVHYQPIVSVDGGTVLAVEALVRWHHGGRILAPAEFLSDLAQAGSMPTLTEHMLRTSLHELRAAGLPWPVTVNFPPDLITDATLRQVVTATVDESSTSNQLIIEITEDAIMRNPEEAAVVLADLRRHGFRVLLDDFGTGWAGLSSLRDFVVDGLKMDASFVNRMAVDHTAASIVRAVTSVADELGVFVIYEGVEDPESLPMLDSFRNGYIQGYATGRPMPIEDLVRWARSRELVEGSTASVNG